MPCRLKVLQDTIDRLEIVIEEFREDTVKLRKIDDMVFDFYPTTGFTRYRGSTNDCLETIFNKYTEMEEILEYCKSESDIIIAELKEKISFLESQNEELKQILEGE